MGRDNWPHMAAKGLSGDQVAGCDPLPRTLLPFSAINLTTQGQSQREPFLACVEREKALSN